MHKSSHNFPQSKVKTSQLNLTKRKYGTKSRLKCKTSFSSLHSTQPRRLLRTGALQTHLDPLIYPTSTPADTPSSLLALSTIAQFPDYHISTRPALTPTIPFMINPNFSRKYLHQCLPRRTRRISSHTTHDSKLFSKLIQHIQENSGYIHPHITLGNFIPQADLKLAATTPNVPRLTPFSTSLTSPRFSFSQHKSSKYLDPTLSQSSSQPSNIPTSPDTTWFHDRTTNEWGFVALDDIPKGTKIASIPSRLLLRPHSPIDLKIPSLNEQDSYFLYNICDVIRLTQTALGNLKIGDKKSLELISFILELILLRTTKHLLMNEPVIDALPYEFLQADLLANPDSNFRRSLANRNNSSFGVQYDYLEHVLFPFLSTHRVNQIPKSLIPKVAATLSKSPNFDPSISLLELLFTHLQVPLNLSKPDDVFDIFHWASHLLRSRATHNVTEDPYGPSAKVRKLLHNAPTSAFIPLTDMFREVEFSNCVLEEKYTPDETAIRTAQHKIAEKRLFEQKQEKERTKKNRQDDRLADERSRLNNPDLSTSEVDFDTLHIQQVAEYLKKENKLSRRRRYGQDQDEDENSPQQIPERNIDDYTDAEDLLTPENSEIFDYAGLSHDIITRRNIKRGEELTLSSYPTLPLTIPEHTMFTDIELEQYIMSSERLKHLLRYSLPRATHIYEHYKDIAMYGDVQDSTIYPSFHAFVPEVTINTTISLAPINGSQHLSRELTPSYYYLAHDFKFSEFPANPHHIQYKKSIDTLTFDAKLQPTAPIPTEDSFPYLSYYDAPVKYIIPQQYDNLDLSNALQSVNTRFDEINKAFKNPPKDTNTDVSWIGPKSEYLEAFHRFIMAPGFLAPLPETLYHLGPMTKHQSKTYLVDQMSKRFSYVATIVENRIRKKHRLSQLQPITAAQWIDGFSTRIDNENEMCKLINLYTTSAMYIENLKNVQNITQCIKSYERALYTHDYDTAMASLDAYHGSSLLGHISKVLASRLGLDRHISLPPIRFNPNSLPQQLNNQHNSIPVPLQPHFYPLPPRWSFLDGIPQDLYRNKRTNEYIPFLPL